jgi:hypothetical protein
MFKDGWTLQRIGERFGVSRERVRQILRKRGVAVATGGAKVRSQKRARELREAVLARRVWRVHQAWGLNLEQYDEIAAKYGKATELRSPFTKYKNQRSAANERKIKWAFTFTEWWKIWQDSGKWPLRGHRATNYVMARFNDVGPYSASNVEIITAHKNIADYYARKKCVVS